VLTRSQLHACRKLSKLGSSLQALGHVAPVVAMDTSHTPVTELAAAPATGQERFDMEKTVPAMSQELLQSRAALLTSQVVTRQHWNVLLRCGCTRLSGRASLPAAGGKPPKSSGAE
jgi:hypothetical protein